MKISYKELRKAPFEVKASLKNLKKTYAIQLKLAKLEDAMSEDAPIEAMEFVLTGLESVTEYIVDLLHLKAAEIEKLENLSQDEVMEIAQRLSMRLMGIPDKEIEEAFKPSDDEGLE